jgi:Na+/melibiose symporter-like transporter
MSAEDADLHGVRGVAAVGRFLLELAGLGALAYWGIQTGADELTRALLAILAAGSLIALWAVIVAPTTKNRVSQRARLWIGSGLLMVSAVALWLVGAPVAAVVLAALIAMDTLVLDRTRT